MVDEQISYLVTQAYRCRQMANDASDPPLKERLLAMASIHIERARQLVAYDNCRDLREIGREGG